MSVKRIFIVSIAFIAFSIFVIVGIADAVKTKDKLDFQQVEIKSRNSEIKGLDVDYDKLNQELDNASKDKETNEAEVKKLEEERKKLEEEKARLEKEVSVLQEKKLAKASQTVINTVTATETALAQTESVKTVVTTGSVINCSNPLNAKQFIYCKESTNRPYATNEIGCRGLGQACPGSKLPCGDYDYVCQDNWFTNYMSERYGSWEKAKAFWLARVPINGKDVGHWW